ncbi:Amidohydrolase [Paramyrothecium foliicola]|nr:Amidohydrolase [Paramyrothecium foliicola]
MITDDRITGIWRAGETLAVSNDTEVVNAAGKIITLGFIDTHRHGWQTLFKTLLSNGTMSEYFSRFNEYSVAGRLSAEQVYISQLAGFIDSGVRVFWSYVFHNVTNYTISKQLVNLREIAEEAPYRNTPVSLGIACDLFGLPLDHAKGGLALRRPDIGVIRTEAKADLVVSDGTTPGMLGRRDPVAAITLHPNIGDVEQVLVDGGFVNKRNFKLVASDYPTVKERFLKTADRAQNTWRKYRIQRGRSSTPMAF